MRVTRSLHLLDVGQLPRSIEQGLLVTVETEEDFKLSAGLRGHPVRFLPGRRRGTEIDIHGAVGVSLNLGAVGCSPCTRPVAAQPGSRAVVPGCRPVLLARRVRGTRQSIGLPAV